MKREEENSAGIQSTRTMAAEMRGMRRWMGVGIWSGWVLLWGACVVGQAQVPQRFVVVLDAAHGGADAGAALVEAAGQQGQGNPQQDTGKATLEKDVTLAMSQQLRALLVARGFTVVMTRVDDQALDGDARATVANEARAGACVVLHATEAGSGVHLFVSSLAPRERSLLMPWKTAQAGWVTASLKLGSALSAALGEPGKLAGQAAGNAETSGEAGSGGAIPVTLGRTTLPGVDSMACPAVAVEVAPLRDGERKVTSEVTDEAYQARVMQAVAAALLVWRGEAGEL